MTRPSRFKQSDLTRALKAAVAAGLQPNSAKIDPVGGEILMTFAGAGSVASENSVDRILRGSGA